MSRFRTSGRSVFELIEGEHQVVRSTFSQIQHLLQQQQSQSSSSGSNSNSTDHTQTIIQLCFMLIREVCVHSHKEEILVYPLLQKLDLSSSTSSPQPTHACQEHVLVERQLLTLENELENSIKLAQPISMNAVNGLQAVMKDLVQHIEEEETILLPALRSSMSEEEAIRLGREWEGLNGRVASRPHPEAPTLGPLAAASNAAQAPIDALQDEARFKHAIPTAPGATTKDVLTPYEQQKLNLDHPSAGPNISMAPFHADAPNPSDLNPQNNQAQLPGKENNAQHQRMSAAQREKQMEMEM